MEFSSKKNALEEKCMEFAVEVVRLYKWINKAQKEYKLADQMMRAGTAVGANYGEAQFAESDLDYVHKLKIAMKECHEVIYWLELMVKAEIVPVERYVKLYDMANEIQVMMGAAVKTVMAKKKETSFVV